MTSGYDKVEHVSAPTTTSGVKETSEVMYDEKTGNPDVVIELQETRRQRAHAGDYISSFQDAFSKQSIRKYAAVLVKFGKFVGPAGIISVAYIDPDNFQTSISSGVQFEFKLLFMVLVSNLIAIFLQVRPLVISKFYILM